jgi:hypothetical protein
VVEENEISHDGNSRRTLSSLGRVVCSELLAVFFSQATLSSLFMLLFDPISMSKYLLIFLCNANSKEREIDVVKHLIKQRYNDEGTGTEWGKECNGKFGNHFL